MTKIVECVPNFSEGRNPDVIEAIAQSIRAVAGVSLLSVEPDKDYNRSVVTFVGEPEAVERAAFEATRTAGELIEMVGQVTGQVGGPAAAADERAVQLVAEAGGAQPQPALRLVDVDPLADLPGPTAETQSFDIIREAAPVIGGKGGGRPERAQGGGTNPDGLDAALATARRHIHEALRQPDRE